jgi:predicted GNAT family N-acyltransferase
MGRVDVVEFGRLSSAQRAELEGDEVDPFDTGLIDTPLSWRAKDRHVALRGPEGRLVASTGLVLADVQLGDEPVIPVVGIGGVIVSAPYRGRGLGSRVIAAALRIAETLGPAAAMLFCHRDRVGFYERHGFAELAGPVLVAQPREFVEMPQLTMWRALREGVIVPRGRVTLHSLPF